MIKAVLWDLDGVLIDSEEIVFTRWAKTFKELGFNLPQDNYYRAIGMRSPEGFAQIVRELGIHDKLTYEDFTNTHKKNRGKYPPILLTPHIEEVLMELHKKYLMAIVTSSSMSWIERMLKNIPYKTYFRAFVTADDIEHPKPDPEPYLVAMKKLEVLGEESVVVEDATHGVNSGKAAGAIVIARKAPHTLHQDVSRADYVVEDLREIPKIIDKLNHD